ncbi:putative monovalent cation/H+ antiporter subunit A [Chitinophaga lutea]|uniref:Putative monovalent cation/H+ antiporter subunit A n=1 Tax=Chitinophaga lutea TaxID=2488634 RepID=A0A3N4PNJ5_9BACT|nr:putative monovalent cation/H+ antiporter subunit A [Chitinophaga lutea]RPE09375.1 putative monovalent cation/H+ antiporter subunit A [Chitinophaga lutea]
MISAVLSGFVFALIVLLAGKYVKGKMAVLTTLLPLGLFVYFISMLPAIAIGPLSFSSSWIPSMGINLDFKLDGLSMLFSLLITGIGTLVFTYASYYLKGHPYLDRFYCYLSLFMASMLGLVLADNVMLLFVFWELTSITSFFLIGFNNDDPVSRRNSLMALAVTGGGGFLLMTGFVLLGAMSGTYSIAAMLSSAEALKAHPWYGLLLFFVFAGAFTKSAQFPFHFWLPGAMKAPTPVSAYLHSATMVKAGVYLLARFTPVLGGHTYWNTTLLIVGGITMLYSAWHAIQRTDLKGILAYSTIAALGTLVFLLGAGTPAAMTAVAVFILVHALYKAALFLVAGILDHETGTRDVTVLRGLRKVMLPVAIAGLLAALSSAGVPLTFGFIGKDLIYEATLHTPAYGYILTGIAVLTNILVLYAGFQAGIRPFAGALPDGFKGVHLPEWRLWIPPLLLAALGLVYGILPMLTDASLVQPVVLSLGGGTPPPLKIWHGFNLVLLLSGVTLAGGCLLYFFRQPAGRFELALQRFDAMSPETLVVKSARGFAAFSGWYTNKLHNGNLRSYVHIIIIFVSGLLVYKLITGVHLYFDMRTNVARLTVYDITVFGIILVAIWKTVSTSSRITAVASMSVVGYCICILFVIYSAPDLAMTQFTIDTLTVVLFVLVLFRLPRFLRINDRKVIVRDSIIAGIFGILISIIALEVMNEPTNKETSRFYAENAYLAAKGKNVVNVMLVDFRGFDTLVEITVLIIAALGVYSLLKLRISSSEKE